VPFDALEAELRQAYEVHAARRQKS
jgi:hypothetical protein